MDLESRLRGAEPTEEDVLEYLTLRVEQITGDGGTASPIDQFWQPGDLDRFRAAREVWASDAPPRYVLDLPLLLCGIAGPAGMPQTTFIEDLTRLWSGYAAWMQSEGRDPLHPGETGRQSGARRARESMQRLRALRSEDTPPEVRSRLLEARRLYDEYMAVCRRRAKVRAELDEEVRQAREAYELARTEPRG